jgi:hypothetical protein
MSSLINKKSSQMMKKLLVKVANDAEDFQIVLDSPTLSILAF